MRRLIPLILISGVLLAAAYRQRASLMLVSRNPLEGHTTIKESWV